MSRISQEVAIVRATSRNFAAGGESEDTYGPIRLVGSLSKLVTRC